MLVALAGLVFAVLELAVIVIAFAGLAAIVVFDWEPAAGTVAAVAFLALLRSGGSRGGGDKR